MMEAMPELTAYLRAMIHPGDEVSWAGLDAEILARYPAALATIIDYRCSSDTIIAEWDTIIALWDTGGWTQVGEEETLQGPMVRLRFPSSVTVK